MVEVTLDFESRFSMACVHRGGVGLIDATTNRRSCSNGIRYSWPFESPVSWMRNLEEKLAEIVANSGHAHPLYIYFLGDSVRCEFIKYLRHRSG